MKLIARRKNWKRNFQRQDITLLNHYLRKRLDTQDYAGKHTGPIIKKSGRKLDNEYLRNTSLTDRK